MMIELGPARQRIEQEGPGPGSSLYFACRVFCATLLLVSVDRNKQEPDYKSLTKMG
jgi:hypothetical protein